MTSVGVIIIVAMIATSIFWKSVDAMTSYSRPSEIRRNENSPTCARIIAAITAVRIGIRSAMRMNATTTALARSTRIADPTFVGSATRLIFTRSPTERKNTLVKASRIGWRAFSSTWLSSLPAMAMPAMKAPSAMERPAIDVIHAALRHSPSAPRIRTS